MELEIIILSEESQTKTNIYLLYIESKKKWYKWTYLLQKRNRPTDIENKLTVTKGESEGEIN